MVLVDSLLYMPVIQYFSPNYAMLDVGGRKMFSERNRVVYVTEPGRNTFLNSLGPGASPLRTLPWTFVFEP